MVNFTIREGETSSFTYTFEAVAPMIPVITVEFVEGTATSDDGYGGTRTGTSIVNVNGYIYGEYSYSFGATIDAVDEKSEQFTLNVYNNGNLSETVTVTILDDLVWHGTELADTWKGSTDADIYNAYAGADVVWGFNGKDEIDGGDGHDRLLGGRGNDLLTGGIGNDTLNGESGSDVLNGGAGKDRMSGGKGADALNGNAGHDNLAGGAGNDTLSGSVGNDTLSGGNGHDKLRGGNGADIVVGGKGRDSIDGGKGNDVLTGGDSADTFIFAKNFGHDEITDFEVVGREKIDVSGAADIRNFRDLSKNYATDTDEGVLIEVNDKSSILITGVQIGDLSGQDFIF